MSDTPRTDAAWLKTVAHNPINALYIESAKLEREIAVMTKERDEARAMRDSFQKGSQMMQSERDSLRQQLAEAQKVNMTDYTEAGWNRAKELEALLAEAQADKAQSIAAFKDLFAMIDEGLLVRDTSKDYGDGWALRMAKFVSRLARAKEALGK